MAADITRVKNLLVGTGPCLDHTPSIDYSELLQARDAELVLVQSELLELFRFWHLKTTRLGRLPGRADFTPVELKKLLPHIALVDVIRSEEGLEFKFRLCGTQIAEGCGADLTGYSWKHTDVPLSIMSRTSDMLNSKVPYHAGNIQAVWAPKHFQHYSVLALPLSADGKTVNMILYGIIFHPKEDK